LADFDDFLKPRKDILGRVDGVSTSSMV